MKGAIFLLMLNREAYVEPPCHAIHCQEVSKIFYEPVKGSRSWKNFFRGNKKAFSAVDHVSFTVGQGEVFGILGPNGSGKSTLIRMIATLLYPDQGELRIFGHDVAKEQLQIRKLINRVSAEASFFKKLSAIENLRFTGRLYGIPGNGERLALSYLKQLGISKEKAIETPLQHYSRGMQQKVAITRALMTSPRLMLLDEPTTGLDPKSRRHVQAFLEQVIKEQESTIVLTTHDMDEAEQLCHRIAIIHHGRILALDTASNLKKRAGVHSLEDVFFHLTGNAGDQDA
jgi:ABC-2 type transport system ATP-binding protein